MEESGCAVGCQLLEYLLPLGWHCVVDEIALVALLVTGGVIIARYTVVSCWGCVASIACIWTVAGVWLIAARSFLGCLLFVW